MPCCVEESGEGEEEEEEEDVNEDQAKKRWYIALWGLDALWRTTRMGKTTKMRRVSITVLRMRMRATRIRTG